MHISSKNNVIKQFSVQYIFYTFFYFYLTNIFTIVFGATLPLNNAESKAFELLVLKLASGLI